MDIFNINKYSFSKYLHWILVLILASSVLWYEKSTGIVVFTIKDYLLLIGVLMAILATSLSIVDRVTIKLASIQ